MRRAVLAAAVELLAEGGFDDFRVAAVAQRSGTHETSIYRHWKTRENLAVDALVTLSADAIPVPDTGDVRGDLVAFLTDLRRYLSTPLGTALLKVVALDLDDDRRRVRRRFWSARLEATLAIIDRAVERRELAPDVDPQLALEMLSAPLQSRILLIDEPLEESLPERLTDLLLRGLAA